MDFTGEVEIPEALIDAQRDGKLVVFVGAGVSVDPPSALPMFGPLVGEIARDSQKQFSKRRLTEEPDVVLGELAMDGIPVHERVRELIDKRGSEPNRLHRAIAGLFRSIESVKLVTTNYDQHLETALADRWQAPIDTFRAPAMPLGHDFSGLVYLHGSISQDPRRLVATDEDFGRAYLTEGWAARFAHEMSKAYPVLFIGYSHNDRVMTYLARGLPSDLRSRFAFVTAGQGDARQWERLRIEPVAYPLKKRRRSHRALGDAIDAWSERSHMGLLDHAVLIANLTADEPPGSPVDRSYLADVINDGDRVAVFTEGATGAAWVDWLMQQETARALFDPSTILTPAQEELAQWLAREILNEPGKLESLAASLGTGIHPTLWRLQAREVWQLQNADRGQVGRWLPFLLATAPRNAWHFLEFILIGCSLPEDRATALILFEWLLEPVLSDSSWIQVEVRGYVFHLREAWTSVIHPGLRDLSVELSAILTRNLAFAHRLLVATGRADRRWDTLSYGRSAIEPHEQDSLLQDGMTIAIDACRDVLIDLLSNEPAIGLGWLKALEQSDAPILRRIAVHGWTERRDISDDERLRWLIDAGLVWDFPAKHEVFRLVGASIAGASSAVRMEFLRAVLAGDVQVGDAEVVDHEHEDYLIYNYLHWITTADPTFEEAEAALKEVQDRHPGFAPREHPDLDRWTTSGISGPRWSLAPNELLALEHPAAIAKLREMYEETVGSQFPGWNDPSSLVGEAVRYQPSWGIELASRFDAEDARDLGLWTGVIHGWILGQLSNEEWGQAFTHVLTHPHLESIRESTSQLLETCLRQPGGPPGDVALDLADRLAASLWDAPNSDVPAVIDGDWLLTAKSSWPGRIASYWLTRIQQEWQNSGDGWSGLGRQFREQLEAGISGTDNKHGLFRAVVARQTEFLLGADRNWTEDSVLELFDWARDASRAEQAWDGLLGGAPPSAELAPLVIDNYLKSIGQLTGKRRERLFQHLAGIAVYDSLERIGADGWLEVAIAMASEADRVHWVRVLGQILHQAPPAYAEGSFESWIEKYWQRRIRGIPTALSGAEGLMMSELVLAAGSRLPAVAGLFLASPIETSQNGRGVIGKIRDASLTEIDPLAVAEVLLHLLKSFTGPFYDRQELHELVLGLGSKLAGTPGADLLGEIQAEAIRLGCTDATTWR